MDPLFWIVAGIGAGALANAISHGGGPGGVLGDLVTGILGAFIGGWVFTGILGPVFGGLAASTGMALAGATIQILLLRAIAARRSSPRHTTPGATFPLSGS